MTDTTDNSELTRVDESQIAAAGTQRFNWVGLNPVQIKGVAQAMALSGMFPDVAKDSAKAFVKIMAGQEMGISPFQAMSDISIIQGKAAAGGNIHASKVKSHPKYDYKVLVHSRTACSIEFFQINYDTKKLESIGISEFNEEDAKAAGLLSKDMWKKYPRNMYFNRAMTAGVRTFCPDALNGVNAYSPEELGAVVDEDGHLVDYQPETVKTAPVAPTKATRADTAKDADIVDGKSVIEAVSEALEVKGFEDAAERKAIALAAAGVGSPSKASPEQWLEVLESINAMSVEELTSLLPDAEVEDAPFKPARPVDRQRIKAYLNSNGIDSENHDDVLKTQYHVEEPAQMSHDDAQRVLAFLEAKAVADKADEVKV